ncbi:long-chain-acyl-CoA synthetase [Mycobacterium avium subsp. hominissuis]|uniref:long-chain-acyl-CoA synthetase FadD6 n=1 Tax=Mycobacterium avium TaxID=1764 RepID=UPI000A00C1D8|nr:long-chain-acyl-CoA synthetase FadD6 [Mycobacterium avium]MBG0729015.1 long-chain-acyl-CoA synthetase [Mycobacterium avium]PBD12930.1 long-chain-acyl-CoA synthetase [Mycobacterium avium subsp. hominissuis]PBJ59340.1 long-chain-acyl-CoA synthetase [Mycobacterium avium subsp. hominissuis]QCR72315.1 long-chain-acyl-CoA synthetase [Mycobacterium avium subsp. hominissuis]QCR75606.1 long-chain-acyl-CoA synthetase [Mycobacterium avium subsp. hominissuis]
MSDRDGGARTAVKLTDIAARVPTVLADLPVIARGTLTGLLAQPGSHKSIGTVFQDRAARYGDRVFLRFGDQQLTYRDANAAANRYAAVLAARGVGHGDVVAIMLRNSPNTVLAMLAAVKCGAVAGMLNYHQRGEVLAHSLGLLDAKVLIAETDLVSAVAECGGSGSTETLTVEDLERFAVSAPATNPASASAVQARDTAFYIFTSGTTGFPKASVMTHLRWLKALAAFGGIGLRLKSSDTLYCCLPLYHNNALTVALSSVINSGATLALGKSFSASKFWDEVIANDATAFIYIGEVCRYLLNQPAKPTDRAHRVRLIAGNGLRPEIWDEFTQRFGIARVCEFYASSEGNAAFINVFNVPRSTGIFPLPLAYVEYDPDTGAPLRGGDGRVRRVPPGQPGLLLSPVNRLQPFDGYTDPESSEKKLVRNAFRDGDCWFNTGDVMSPQGLGHAAFVDRLGDTFRWKGENVATTQVEAALASDGSVEDCTVFGVEVPRTGGRAGMAAIKLRDGAEFDGRSLARTVYEQLPVYALPLFVRVVDSIEQTTTFKSRKVELREQGYGPEVKDPLYVLAGRDEGYVPFYDEYPDEVAEGKRP